MQFLLFRYMYPIITFIGKNHSHKKYSVSYKLFYFINYQSPKGIYVSMYTIGFICLHHVINIHNKANGGFVRSGIRRRTSVTDAK